MSSQLVSEPRPETREAARVARVGAHPVFLGSLSGLLLWLAFPPVGLSPLAWVALVPLFVLIPSRRSRAALYLGAWLGGLVFWLLALSWILCIDATAATGWGAMAGALSLLWPIFLGLSRLALNRLHLPLMLAAPIIWTAIEYVRAYLLTGFPWYYLAHSQYRLLPLIQLADFAGALGLSLLVAAANAFVVDALTIPLFRPGPRGRRWNRGIVARLASLFLALAGTAAYGIYRLETSRFTPGPRVGLIQSNLMQRYKMGKTSGEILMVYVDLVHRAARSEPRPDLIVWPETSYPNGYVTIEPGLDPAELDRQGKLLNPDMSARDWVDRRDFIDDDLHAMADQLGIPMMVGSTLYEFRRDGVDRFNAALLIEPGRVNVKAGTRPVLGYNKLHLVPFGEYVPLLKTFPWLTALTPYRNGYVPSLAFGLKPSWFDGPKYRYASAICFEDTVPQVVRRLFREIPDGRQPDVLVNLSNDGWFTWLDPKGTVHGSAEHEMHLAVSVFRSVEHRVPLVRAANTGISAVVDGDGRVVASLPPAQDGVLVADVPLDPRVGLYTAWGDWVGLGCLAITMGLVPLGLLSGRRAVKEKRLASEN